MVLVNVIVWGFIVGGGGWLNWDDLKQAWRRFKERVRSVWYGIASRTYVFTAPKNLIHHVFWFYTWSVWYWCKRRIMGLVAWCKRLLTRIRRNPAIVLLVIAWVFIGFSVWRFSPDLYELYGKLAQQILEGEKTADEYRGIAIRYFGIIAGAGAIIGYIFATGRNIILDGQNKINAQAQITESMVQAITQIGAVNEGKPNIEVRLGGLYSLQRIMQDSPRDEMTIARIFYAYVRENIKRDKPKKIKRNKEGEIIYLRLPEDIQAVLIIINKLNEKWREQGIEWLNDAQLNFSHTDFSGYSLRNIDFRDTALKSADFSDTDLQNADLSDANFHDSNLQNALLFNTDLSGAHLAYVDLSNTSLLEGYFVSANLRCSKLSGTDFRESYLENVDFKHADLSDAILFGVNLSKTKGLSQENLNSAYGDKATTIPAHLTYPVSWKKYDID